MCRIGFLQGINQDGVLSQGRISCISGWAQSYCVAKNYVALTPRSFCFYLLSAGTIDVCHCIWFIWCWGLNPGLGKHHSCSAECWTLGQISASPTETSLVPRMTLKELCRPPAPWIFSPGAPLLGIPPIQLFCLCVLLLDVNIGDAKL